MNEEWISDKTRYACDGLMRQRLDKPYVRQGKTLKPATWGEAFEAIAKAVKKAAPDRIGVIAGDLQDAESMKAALDLSARPGLAEPRLPPGRREAAIGSGAREAYLFNSTIAGIDEADAIMLIGTNPRLEAPVLNARIRKRWLTWRASVAVIGEEADLTYDYDHLGDGPTLLRRLAGRTRFAEAKARAADDHPGAGRARPADGAAVLAMAAKAAERPSGARRLERFNVLHTAAARVGGLDLGFVPGEGGMDAEAMVQKGALDVLFLLGADEIDVSQTDALVVYLGTHGDRGAHRADVILPGAAYTEKAGSTSTPRAGRRWPPAPCSPRARRERTGRS